MRTQEEIRDEYQRTEVDDEIIKDPNHTNAYVMKNDEWRRKLQEKYDATLPAAEQFAIWLHNNLCRYDHILECSFHYHRIHQLDYDWDTNYVCKDYLCRAKLLLRIMGKNNIPIEKVKEIILAATSSEGGKCDD